LKNRGEHTVVCDTAQPNDGIGKINQRSIAMTTANPHNPQATQALLQATTAWTIELSAVERALADGADPDAKTHAGESALAKAVLNQNLECVKALVSAGADCGASNAVGGHTPLMFAAALLWLPGIEFLAPFSDPAHKNHGQSVLDFLVRDDLTQWRSRFDDDFQTKTKALKILLPLLQCSGEEWEAVAHVATVANDADLLSRCAKHCDMASIWRGNPPQRLLITAASMGAADALDVLLGAGCDPQKIGANNETALLAAMRASQKTSGAAHARWRCIEKLLPLSDADAKNASGETPLFIAIAMGDIPCAELVAKKANPNILSRAGNTALHDAIINAAERVVQILAPISDLSVIGGDGANAVDLAIHVAVTAKGETVRWRILETLICCLSPQAAVAASLKTAMELMPKTAPLMEARELEITVEGAGVDASLPTERRSLSEKRQRPPIRSL